MHGGLTDDPTAELDRLFATLVWNVLPGGCLAGGSCGKIDDVVVLPARARIALARYPELTAVLVAAILGLSVQRPLGWLATRQGINVLLAVLVFATAVTIEPAALRRLTAAWRPLLAALVAGVTVLPALSWAVSRMVAAGSLRDGVLALGLAPCEIASVAMTAMAGGEAALAAGALIGSTLVTVAFAGPILALEAGRAGFSPGGIIVNLALVVALPLAAGIVLRSWVPLTKGVLSTARAERAASAVALFAVAALVALIAAEVQLSFRYAGVAAALVAFLAGSAVTGRLLGARTRPATAAALLLTTSMRDFAIAAGLAAAAFGPAAAAPLGLYGILVLVWGAAVAGVLRRRNAASAAGVPTPVPAADRDLIRESGVSPSVAAVRSRPWRSSRTRASKPRTGHLPNRASHHQVVIGADDTWAPSDSTIVFSWIVNRYQGQ